MGHRHNRRRTRPRSRNRDILRVEQSPPTRTCDITVPAVPATTAEPDQCCHRAAACVSCDPISTYSAPTWHHGYMAWQKRGSRLQLETAGLEEQYRLFGGEPGDDPDLCDRMLEYFGGLDYIDSVPKSPG